jgi:hypothetical protein
MPVIEAPYAETPNAAEATLSGEERVAHAIELENSGDPELTAAVVTERAREAMQRAMNRER